MRLEKRLEKGLAVLAARLWASAGAVSMLGFAGNQRAGSEEPSSSSLGAPSRTRAGGIW